MLHQFLFATGEQIQADGQQSLQASNHQRSLHFLVLVSLLVAVLLFFLK